MGIKSNEDKYSFVMLKIKAAQVKSDTHEIEMSLRIAIYGLGKHGEIERAHHL